MSALRRLRSSRHQLGLLDSETASKMIMSRSLIKAELKQWPMEGNGMGP